MENIRVNFNVGPVDTTESLVGSIDYDVNDSNDEKEIGLVIRKTIKRLGIAKNAVILGFFEIFKANHKIYDVDLFRIGNIVRNDIKKA